MRALNGMQKGNSDDGYIPQLLDLHISKDDDLRIFIVTEYFEYDLRSLFLHHLHTLSFDDIVSIIY